MPSIDKAQSAAGPAGRCRRRALIGLAFVAATGALALAAFAASPVDGIGTQVVVPVVASTASFSSEVFAYNPNGTTLDLAIDYVGGTGTPLPGLRSCTQATVAPDRTVVINVAVQCALGSLNNFGQLRLTSAGTGNLPFAAYSRAQTPDGIGFSIEGLPVGLFSTDHIVTGLRSGGNAPAYQTNCFVGTLGEAAGYQIALFDATSGTALGSVISGTLAANELLRILDVFTAASVFPGTYTNVNAYITENTVGAEPALLAFCTVQENTNFSADYRIGKTVLVQDASRERDSTTIAGRVGGAFSVVAGSNSNLHEIYFRAPDKVSCSLTGPDVANLELRLLDQRATEVDAAAAGGNGHVLAGGSAVTAFGPVPLGTRGAATLQSVDGNGVNGRYLIQVEGNETATGTKAYGIRCQSGNGHTRPALVGQVGKDVF
jgi:hypothetical protein